MVTQGATPKQLVNQWSHIKNVIGCLFGFTSVRFMCAYIAGPIDTCLASSLTWPQGIIPCYYVVHCYLYLQASVWHCDGADRYLASPSDRGYNCPVLRIVHWWHRTIRSGFVMEDWKTSLTQQIHHTLLHRVPT
ncbi:hypothetical protein F4775DRAFT_556674 [Biscogniauxia sp. FL1348]|nr:hypothetical protein F4775DRAFT_556674 [Biscogniauxia sp. FL1348]